MDQILKAYDKFIAEHTSIRASLHAGSIEQLEELNADFSTWMRACLHILVFSIVVILKFFSLQPSTPPAQTSLFSSSVPPVPWKDLALSMHVQSELERLYFVCFCIVLIN
jgi:hypothetical protein